MKKAQKQEMIYLLEHLLGCFDDDNPDEVIHSGFCSATMFLIECSIITRKEGISLIEYLKENKPKRGVHYCKSKTSNLFWWKSYLRKPRMEFIQYLIKKLKK